MVYIGRDFVGIEKILLGVVYTCIPTLYAAVIFAIFGQLPILA